MQNESDGWGKVADTAIRELSKGVSALSEGTLRRWNEKRDLIHAMNMCSIIEGARTKGCQSGSISLNVDSGWFLNFLDKCQTVSDADVQDLWSRILARESDAPGSFSQLTVNSLENFGKRDAEWFISLCGFICDINSEPVPLIDRPSHEIYTQNGINAEVLEHLCTLNVIESATFWGGGRGTTRPQEPHLSPGESIFIFYFHKKLEYMNAGNDNDNVSLGSIALTSIGKELLSICENKPVEGFFEYLKHRNWSSMFGSKCSVEDEKIIRINVPLSR